MTKAPTMREQYMAVYAILADRGEANLADFIAGRINQLDKRAKAPRKPTQEQLENVAYKDEIVNVLANATEDMRATAVANEIGVSVQKASALLRQLVKDGFVERVEDGKAVTFKVAE
jgi:DNA-binding MarR family transcriptional regulator